MMHIRYVCIHTHVIRRSYSSMHSRNAVQLRLAQPLAQQVSCKVLIEGLKQGFRRGITYLQIRATLSNAYSYCLWSFLADCLRELMFRLPLAARKVHLVVPYHLPTVAVLRAQL